MKLKDLEALLQEVTPFAAPKIELEQYPTPPHLASRLLFAIQQSFEGLEGRSVLDLGCGTGMLSVGAAALGASAVVGVDADEEALAQCRETLQGLAEEGLECASAVDLVHARAETLADLFPARSFDVVVSNPPFGTRCKGADAMFVRQGLRLARRAVYSLHKSSTRDYLRKMALREPGCSGAEVLAQLRFDLPQTYAFHKSKTKDIEVDLWRFELDASSAACDGGRDRSL
ncbi:hypothetical protein H632_c313p0 [Helicosporidium sp. ATCC 50920]|nr:hypothetical protein H632_c313p0 [Helicosporidium sp. ATCC 50920]|eukprot:KDD76210.1 hypothetical protein H632_c313p0 [Helicosporidium sp. ATCC 50920]